MKCSSPLTTGGSCGQTARFSLGTRVFCRRHASENLFQRVIAEERLCTVIGLRKLDE